MRELIFCVIAVLVIYSCASREAEMDSVLDQRILEQFSKQNPIESPVGANSLWGRIAFAQVHSKTLNG